MNIQYEILINIFPPVFYNCLHRCTCVQRPIKYSNTHLL